MRSLLLSIMTVACCGQLAVAQPPKLVSHEDLVYCKAGKMELKLDLYRPEGDAVLPAVAVIHGGGWKHGDKESMRLVAKQFALQGFVATTVQYRLSNVAKFPAQVEDVKCSIRWLRANAKQYGVDPKRIGAAGASAGGHLALMLGLMDDKDGLEGNGGYDKQSSKVQAVVNYFGPFDLTRKDWRPEVQPLLTDFLGGTLEEQAERYRLASPATYVDAKDPPVLTFHGDKDNIVPHTQALHLDKTLKDKGVDSTLVTIHGAGHGWFGPKLLQTQQLAIEFLQKNLKE